MENFNPFPVIEKLERVQSVFRTVQDSVLPLNDSNETAKFLNGLDEEFTSVAFEAASMKISLSDFKNNHGEPLTQWNAFLNAFGSLHTTQIHIGFGWTLAQEKLNPLEWLTLFAPLHRYRILDGFGYYEGFFRKRKSVVNKEQLLTSDETALAAYDQGLGRSLWYLNRANANVAAQIIESFEHKRRENLWRGLGIATAYVGGCDEALLRNLKILSGNNFQHFATGVALSFISRVKANSVTAESEEILINICGKTKTGLIKIEAEFYSGNNPDDDTIFPRWLGFLSDALIKPNHVIH